MKRIDYSRNGDEKALCSLIEEHQKKQKKLYPLRINAITVIYVPKSKCNAKYAEAYRKKIDIFKKEIAR